MQSALDTFSEVLIISNWIKHTMTGKMWIGHARLLEELPSTSTEYCKMYRILRIVGNHCFTYPDKAHFVQM